MNRKSNADLDIIFLAYFHRYGWIAMTLITLFLFPDKIFVIFSMSYLMISAWTLIGYKRKWKHIYCSFQNMNHEKMTPYSVDWNRVKKSDAYGIPIIFGVLGLVSLLAAIFLS